MGGAIAYSLAKQHYGDICGGFNICKKSGVHLVTIPICSSSLQVHDKHFYCFILILLTYQD